MTFEEKSKRWRKERASTNVRHINIIAHLALKSDFRPEERAIIINIMVAQFFFNSWFPSPVDESWPMKHVEDTFEARTGMQYSSNDRESTEAAFVAAL